jgi:hypothetical protein
MAKFHFPKLPLAQAEIQRMTAFSPHESFFRSKSRRGRFQALGQFAFGAVRYPLETPFWMMVNTALLIKKLGQLIYNAVALASLSKKRRGNVKVYAIQALDYACLLPLIPLMRACSLMRRLAAAIIHPGLYYRSPAHCTKEQQAHYYQKQTDELFQKLMHKDGLTKEQKQDIWHLKKQMKRCIQKAHTFERKIVVAKACGIAVKELEGKIDVALLKRFKEFLDQEEKNI